MHPTTRGFEPPRLPATSNPSNVGVCKRCGGKGWDYVRKARMSWRIWVTEDCPDCGGTGKINDQNH